MMFRNLVFLASVGAASSMDVYTAMIMPLSSNYTAEGTMVVMVEEGSTSIFYGGHVMGLESSLDATMCTAMNGCGLHIHVGMSCESVETQGGHLYETDEDPWLEARHSTTADGVLIEGTWLEIGTNEVNGRVVIVHNEAGERAGCGILQPVMESMTQLSAMTSPLGDDSMAEAETFVAGDDMFLCYAGVARGLEANVMSFMSEGGMDWWTLVRNGGRPLVDGGLSFYHSGWHGLLWKLPYGWVCYIHG
ncbi:hypothetical protein FisN_15Lh059 [Fistulifera solaris]|uniref:Superoxide dismutase copper/zinc binding domain-containing protein n=1 Tax=Fistulifera solaris TaxID=1519565 RepID=A0A1Z5KIB2_FISSO|nr:hypothetical protein FisN_15Lh059 [Fistulifera solaris]|eukprot:GAX25688.1 hypothetical protein FisN_15Lh059 [Fistulifera solaris]